MDERTSSPNGTTKAAPEADFPNLSRRGFLGGVGGAAAVAAVGGFTLEPTIPGASVAHAVETGPIMGGAARLAAARANRIAAADRMFSEGFAAHANNGDEDLYPNRIANFSKGMPHTSIGEVEPAAYDAFLAAVSSGDPDLFNLIPMGAHVLPNGLTALKNPQSGLAFDTHGNDVCQFSNPPAPPFASAWQAGEMVEHYWMSLLRDAKFTFYDTNPLVEAACTELSSLSDFRGPKVDGQVTPQTLFRDRFPGCTDGPYISQFLLKGTPFGVEFVERRMRTLAPNINYMTNFADYLAVQNGAFPLTQVFDTTRRYIRNARDLAEWVHIDVLFQAYFNAALILGAGPSPLNLPTRGGIGCPLGPGNPYTRGLNANQYGFTTWGGPYIMTLLCEAARALKAVWFQKWFVHRRMRPENFGARIHVHKTGLAEYPIHDEVLNCEALDRVHNRYGSYLHPQTFPEGSPTHPSYGAGHATVAGACVTILKALFDESHVIPNPVTPRLQGLNLQPYVGEPLTVGGELNKLASNVATGRNLAGVHWRTDAEESMKLGEAVSIAILKDHVRTFNEGGWFEFTKFDGTHVIIE